MGKAERIELFYLWQGCGGAVTCLRDYFSSERGQSIHRQSMPTDASECGGEDEQWYFSDCFHFLRELRSKVIIFKIG